ncbi:MAG TPA: hypothetical protein VMF50_04055 [Candidatus Binataceae bacterium]|nr:hypothetical protein [Candidatus Binataceae bacterium]
MLAVSMWLCTSAVFVCEGAALVERLHEKHPVVMKQVARLKIRTSKRWLSIAETSLSGLDYFAKYKEYRGIGSNRRDNRWRFTPLVEALIIAILSLGDTIV